jgi:hypothetical protein
VQANQGALGPFGPGNVPNSPARNVSTPQTVRQIAQSQYPWAKLQIARDTPFPRYGHAANHIAARGEVFVMGGLKGQNVFGDLWVIETGKL